jgi:hypothetical protein
MFIKYKLKRKKEREKKHEKDSLSRNLRHIFNLILKDHVRRTKWLSQLVKLM